MATEKRMIYAHDLWSDIMMLPHNGDMISSEEVEQAIQDAPTVDAVPVDDIILHHILIDNEGVPEVKLQIGDRYFILRGDPVDVRQVVHGRWKYAPDGAEYCPICGIYPDDEVNHGYDYCPNCGADMRERKDNE